MGRGVIDPRDNPAAQTFHGYAQIVTHRALKDAFIAILSGNPLVIDESVVQVAWVGDDRRGTLVMSDADRTYGYYLVLTLTPLNLARVQQLPGTARDPFVPPYPLPETWRTVLEDDQVVWELSNVEVTSVDIRSQS